MIAITVISASTWNTWKNPPRRPSPEAWNRRVWAHRGCLLHLYPAMARSQSHSRQHTGEKCSTHHYAAEQHLNCQPGTGIYTPSFKPGQPFLSVGRYQSPGLVILGFRWLFSVNRSPWVTGRRASGSTVAAGPAKTFLRSLANDEICCGDPVIEEIVRFYIAQKANSTPKKIPPIYLLLRWPVTTKNIEIISIIEKTINTPHSPLLP